MASKTLLDEGTVDSVYIVVPTTNLVDGWIAEFKKWGLEVYLPRVQIECIQTSYKNEYPTPSEAGGIHPNKALLIADEVHTTLSPKYRALYNAD